MKTISHSVEGPNEASLIVEHEDGWRVRVNVFVSSRGVILFGFRHPDPSMTERIGPVIDRLNRLVPFDVADLAIVA